VARCLALGLPRQHAGRLDAAPTIPEAASASSLTSDATPETADVVDER
jgi:hypothetical protein